MLHGRVAVALGLLCAGLPAPGRAQRLVLDLQSGRPPNVAVSVQDLLERQSFIDALQSGFPLYMEYRLALRQPQAIRDRTLRDEVWEVVVVYDPVRERYTLRSTLDPAGTRVLLPDRAALALRLAQVAIWPFQGPASGELYYEADVEARMLSDDDVDEAFAWLRGETADSGGGGLKDPGLLARVARRFLMRVTALPHVRLHARTARFTVP
jgi:hypothetical protein